MTARTCSIVMLSLVLVAAPIAAQEEPPPVPAPAPEEPPAQAQRPGSILVELGYWISQPAGLEYTPATQSSLTGSDTTLLSVPYGTIARPRYRVGYVFRNGIGDFILTYYSQTQRSRIQATSPGNFVFGETLVNPFFAGVLDDGRADGFVSDSTTAIRDFRLDFGREAFDTPRAKGKWFIGLRRMSHRRELSARYLALVPPPDQFPPLVPPFGPRPDLVPLPDTAVSESQYSGRGAELGMDFVVPFGAKGKVSFEAGLALAALRGRIRSRYLSLTRVYAVQGLQDFCGGATCVLAPPFDEFSLQIQDVGVTINVIDHINQLTVPIGLNAPSLSSTGEILDTYLGFRWRAWRGLEAFAGFRSTRYGNVAAELRPKTVSVSANGVLNVQDVSRDRHSVHYEGYYLGLSFVY